ncbi:hypothetical protein HanRHA438_Chr04g0161401 [Helianthus annuus]|nr:hypothetical protein HanRHA438_Chr04g0161401 [Helianthus annuus]
MIGWIIVFHCYQASLFSCCSWCKNVGERDNLERERVLRERERYSFCICNFYFFIFLFFKLNR